MPALPIRIFYFEAAQVPQQASFFGAVWQDDERAARATKVASASKVLMG
ncbi:MAG TPA: hypothetical protein VFV83_00575 [Chthoniobacteraceae bacterium]|nr:hypothetical protein [Chthoniobacteraceae bacterium]